jgi:hypothetical protein
MATSFYDKHLPDYGALDDKTGQWRGFRFGVRENDGGIGIDMGPIGDNVDDPTYYRAFLNVAEAEELVAAFQEAIERARSKTRGQPTHPRRAKDV